MKKIRKLESIDGFYPFPKYDFLDKLVSLSKQNFPDFHIESIEADDFEFYSYEDLTTYIKENKVSDIKKISLRLRNKTDESSWEENSTLYIRWKNCILDFSMHSSDPKLLNSLEKTVKNSFVFKSSFLKDCFLYGLPILVSLLIIIPLFVFSKNWLKMHLNPEYISVIFSTLLFMILFGSANFFSSLIKNITIPLEDKPQSFHKKELSKVGYAAISSILTAILFFIGNYLFF